MQKLWQFWFSVEYTCFRGSGIRMGQRYYCLWRYAVLPLRPSGTTVGAILKPLPRKQVYSTGNQNCHNFCIWAPNWANSSLLDRARRVVRRGRGVCLANKGVKPPTEKNQHTLQHRKHHRRCMWTPFLMNSSLSWRWPKALKLTKRNTKQEPRKMMQGCNGLSSLRTIRSSYLLESPHW